MNKSVNRILFVDDDRIQHMINRKNLLRLKPDLELFFFENPFLALEWMESNQADLLLLDVNMPEMSGWDFLNELVKKGNEIEVKMITSSIDPEDIQKSSEFFQVSGFLVKPLQGDVLEEFLGERS